MLTHIVVWKYRPEIEQEVRDEARAHAAKLVLNDQRDREFCRLVLDVLKLPRSFDTGLVALFRDRAALEAYTIHPEHIKVAAFGKPSASRWLPWIF